MKGAGWVGCGNRAGRNCWEADGAGSTGAGVGGGLFQAVGGRKRRAL